MPTYLLRAADSDLSGGADWNKQLLYGTEGAATLSASILKTATETQYGYSNASIPYNAAWPTGNWTVRVYVTTGSSYIYGSVSISRVNSAGTVQQTCTVSGEQQMTNAGSYTFSFTNLAWTAGAVGDRIRINYLFRNSKTNGSISIVIRTGTDTDVVTPVPYTPVSTLSVSDAVTPTLSRVSARFRDLSVSDAVAPVLAKAFIAVRTLSVSDAVTPILVEYQTWARTLSATVGATVTLARIGYYFRTLSATCGATVTLGRIAYLFRSLATTCGATPILASATTWARSLAVASSVTPTLDRLVLYLRTLSATAGGTLTLSRCTTWARTMAATVGAIPILSRGADFFRAMASSSPVVPTLARQAGFFRELVTSSSVVPSLSRIAAYLRSLATASGSGLGLVVDVHSGGGTVTEIEINGTCGSSPSMGTENPIIAKLKRVYCSIMSLFV